jgi:hypothetical protein
MDSHECGKLPCGRLAGGLHRRLLAGNRGGGSRTGTGERGRLVWYTPPDHSTTHPETPPTSHKREEFAAHHDRDVHDFGGQQGARRPAGVTRQGAAQGQGGPIRRPSLPPARYRGWRAPGHRCHSRTPAPIAQATAAHDAQRRAQTSASMAGRPAESPGEPPPSSHAIKCGLRDAATDAWGPCRAGRGRAGHQAQNHGSGFSRALQW